MGSDDLFKKRREARKQRRHEFKTPKANSYLIVTEGERTEPIYFNGIKKLIQDSVGGRVDVVESPTIDVRGEGCATSKLLEVTEQIVKDAKIMYQNIWVVFDKDDFLDFDQAIRCGDEKGYKVAWSNQSFEYWLYLHFNYSDSALHRHEWNSKLDDIFKQYGWGSYQKNCKDIFTYMNLYGGVDTAIKFAKRRMSGFETSGMKPSEYDPGTTVYKLVEELKQYYEQEN